MSKEKFTRLNIAFKLPLLIEKYALNLSKSLARTADAYFAIDGRNFHPHLTIYSPEFPQSNKNKVIKAVKQIAKNHPHLKLNFREIITGQGFLVANFQLSRKIKLLHEKIVKTLNPLRENHIREKYLSSYHMRFSQAQKKNILKYGYPGVMKLYHPHLTIIRFKDAKRAKKLTKTIDWRMKEFIIDTVAIYEMGEHGTCKKLIKELKLKKYYQKQC